MGKNRSGHTPQPRKTGTTPTIRFVNLDRSEFTEKDRERQTKVFRRLRAEKVDPDALVRWLAGNRRLRDALGAIRDEGEAVAVTRLWRRVETLQKRVEEAHQLAVSINEIPEEWRSRLRNLSANLNVFQPDPVQHDMDRARLSRKHLADVSVKAASPKARQKSEFAGRVLRMVHARILRVMEQRAQQEFSVKPPIYSARLTALFLKATFPTYFARLTAEQVRRRVYT